MGITRKQTRQIVNHGHVLVNGKKVDIPSYLVKAGDVITIKSKSTAFLKSVTEMIDMACAPAWMTIDKEALKITFDRIPEREELDPEIKEHLEMCIRDRKQLDTEQDAIQTEMDAVSKVIEKNTESTFKTFG